MYVLLWRYRVLRGKEAEFERHYAPEGTWARFFSAGQGYLGTELLGDGRHEYVTIDRWESELDYLRFRAANQAEYVSIDERCARLTEREEALGAFTRHPA